MPYRFFLYCLLSGLFAGAAVATVIHGNTLFSVDEHDGSLALVCGDRWFSANITLPANQERGHVYFDGALKPRRAYTDATLRTFVPNEFFILKFNDGYGGRIRVYKEKKQTSWQAVLIESDKTAPRLLGTCRSTATNAS